MVAYNMSQDTKAYRSYVRYCLKIGVKPADFASWYLKDMGFFFRPSGSGEIIGKTLEKHSQIYPGGKTKGIKTEAYGLGGIYVQTPYVRHESIVSNWAFQFPSIHQSQLKETTRHSQIGHAEGINIDPSAGLPVLKEVV